MSRFAEPASEMDDETNIRYVKKLTEALNDLRKENQLCDIVVNVGGRAFNAHRGVLAASSSYFKAMLTSGFSETDQEEITIDGKAEHFEILLQHIYTGKLDVYERTNQDDVCSILEMANYLQLMDVLSTCTSLIQDWYTELKDKITIIGVTFRYLLVAKANNLMDLAKSSECCLQKNLKMIKECKVFLEDASVEFMEEFLCGENLATADEEEEVLLLVLEWLKFDWDNRRTHTCRLLQKVRLGLVPEDRCKELLDDSILSIPECKALFDKVVQLQGAPDSKHAIARQNPELFATRSTITAPVSIESRGPMKKSYFCYYDAHTLAWEKMESSDLPWTIDQSLFQRRSDDRFFPDGSSLHSLVEANGKLYMAGGKTEAGAIKQDLYCYNPGTNQWNRLPSMITPRFRFPFVHLDGWLYAIGGSRVLYHITNVERFNLEARKWEPVAPLGTRDTNYKLLTAEGKLLKYGMTTSCPSDPNYKPLTADGHGKLWVYRTSTSCPGTGDPNYELLTAVGHEGKLLMYGISTSCPEGIIGHGRGSTTCDSNAKFQLTLKVYLPEVDKWQIALTEEHLFYSAVFMRPPSLLVHNNICYRIMHHHVSQENRNESYLLSRPVVNVLELKHHRTEVTVTIGEYIKQDYIPDNKVFAFRIHEEVFATEMESVFNTGITIDDDLSTDVDLSKVEAAVRNPSGAPWEGSSSRIANLRFDKRVMSGEVDVDVGQRSSFEEEEDY
ncbi:kelch-like protein 25 [Amphiura filiformis]|uniref:kelch-like protein 25 n=1 Tax=Amphiura filiformis TaxID=82378 RepID=UPI003B20F677